LADEGYKKRSEQRMTNVLLILIFFPIAIPICIIRARGIAGLGVVAAHFIGLMVVQIIAWYVTGLLVYGILSPG
jgi:hypothetical protein